MIPRGDEKVMCPHEGGACGDALHAERNRRQNAVIRHSMLDAARGRVRVVRSRRRFGMPALPTHWWPSKGDDFDIFAYAFWSDVNERTMI
jgi:hypothetical protein